jgi:hypothetical protein
LRKWSSPFDSQKARGIHERRVLFCQTSQFDSSSPDLLASSRRLSHRNTQLDIAWLIGITNASSQFSDVSPPAVNGYFWRPARNLRCAAIGRTA